MLNIFSLAQNKMMDDYIALWKGSYRRLPGQEGCKMVW